MNPDSPMGDWPLYRRLLGYVKPYLSAFVFSIVGFVVYSLGNVLLADLAQFLLDSLGEENPGQLGFVAAAAQWLWPPGDRTSVEYARIAVPVAAVVLSLGRALGFFAGNYFMNTVARSVVHDLRTALYDVLLRVPRRYLDDHSSGSLVSKLTFNVEQVSGAASDALKTLLREGLTVVALVTYMLYLNWRLALVFFAVAPAIGLVVAIVGRHFRRYSRRIQESMGSVTELSAETFDAIEEIRMYQAGPQWSARFHNASLFNRNQSLKLALVQAISTPVIQTLLALALGALFWFALDPDILVAFSAGSLVAFITAAAQLGKPIRTLSGVQSIIQKGLAAAEDVFAQLDSAAESDTGARQLKAVRGAFQLENLRFTYPGTDCPALHDINMQIEAGERIAIVGRSGSGKSTLTQLMTRFYSPDSGCILLDGEAIDSYTLDSYRSQIALVSQRVVLFSGTVRDNIALGVTESADMTLIRAAAEKAQALGFIEALPNGFDTDLGEGGARLSGGQRQRIAIARAFLKDAPILILDEATSALDNESERALQAAVDQASIDRTVIAIAHRPVTIEQADRVVVLDAGRVVATGHHSALLAQDGVYRALYQQALSDIE